MIPSVRSEDSTSMSSREALLAPPVRLRLLVARRSWGLSGPRQADQQREGTGCCACCGLQSDGLERLIAMIWMSATSDRDLGRESPHIGVAKPLMQSSNGPATAHESPDQDASASSLATFTTSTAGLTAPSASVSPRPPLSGAKTNRLTRGRAGNASPAPGSARLSADRKTD